MTDDNLGPHGRALLDAAGPAMGPDADAARRMRAKIAATVGGAAVAGVAAKSAIATKLGVVGVVAALAIGALVYARRDPAPVVSPAPVVAPIAHVEVARPAPASVPPVAPIAPIEQEMPAIDVGSAKPKAAAKPVTAVTIALAREVELVDHAMASLKAHDPRAALASIRIYDVESSGRGQLAEDAAAIEVEALCTLKDPTAAARLAAFDQRYAQSSQRARLAATCK